jgi:hypothetical protein
MQLRDMGATVYVLILMIALVFGLVVFMDYYEERCIVRCKETRDLLIERIKDMKRSGAIDDLSAIELFKAVHAVPFEEHVRRCMTRGNPATLYPSELASVFESDDR